MQRHSAATSSPVSSNIWSGDDAWMYLENWSWNSECQEVLIVVQLPMMNGRFVVVVVVESHVWHALAVTIASAPSDLCVVAIPRCQHPERIFAVLNDEMSSYAEALAVMTKHFVAMVHRLDVVESGDHLQ